MKKLIIILLLFIQIPLFAHRYYVSVTDGDDSDTGLTTALAWATISKVNGFAFAAGDTVSFNKGDTWRETLTIPRAGAIGTYMVYNSYGTGNNPRILGSNTTTWTDQGSNIYKSDQTFTDPYGGTYDAEAFFENIDGTKTWGIHVANTGLLNAEFKWTWAANYVYVYAASDPDVRYTAVEIPQRSYIIALNSKNYLQFNGIDLYYSILAGYVFGGWPQASQTGLIIENSTIGYIGIKNSENAYGIDAGYSDMIVRHCDISNCGRRGISFHLYGLDWTMHNVLIEDNYFHDGWHTTGPDLSVGSSAYYTASIDSMIIRRNKFYDPPTTTGFSELIFIQNSNGGVAGATLDDIYIYANIFINSSNGGIHMETANGVHIYNNTFYNHNTVSVGNTFHINIAKVSPGYCTNISIKNNIFYTTSTYTSSGGCPIFVKSGAIVNYAAVDADYNIYYRYNNSVRVIEFESIHNYLMTELATLRSTTGWEAHGQFASAAMTDPANQDFTLTEGSPAIEAGVGLGINYDYNERPYSATPSLGAFEYIEVDTTATNILTFTFSTQIGISAIDTTAHTVTAIMTEGEDITSITPIITLSPTATIDPLSGVSQNFTNPVVYTVTGGDAVTEQAWTVTITEDVTPSSSTDIVTFTLAEQTGAATINSVTHTISIEVIGGTNVTSLTPTITLSEAATIDPLSGIAGNFTNPVVYTVTAEDAVTEQAWTITVIVGISLPVVSTGTSYLSFLTSISAMVNGNVYESEGTVTVYGACFSTSVNPTIANNKVEYVFDEFGFHNIPIYGLTGGTTYHFRFYATNESGTSYGADVTFSTKNFIIGTYKSKIGKYKDNFGIIK